MLNIFVINSGSSSIKYDLFQMPADSAVCSGMVEEIGSAHATITHKVKRDGQEKSTTLKHKIPDHEAGIMEIVKLLTKGEHAILQHPEDVNIVGHRIVHGGEKYTGATVLTAEVKKEIKKLFPLAPLHNPDNLKGVEIAEKVFTKAKQVAVFDTAFHHTLSEKAFRYALPEKLYNDLGIRVYGFHGTSHQYVSRKAGGYLQKPDARIISIHLGNGCSMAAIQNGKSVDTSMGLTPLDGLVMGTRSGSIDASVLLYLMNEANYSADQLSELLNKKSGMLGLTGHSDMRDIKQMLDDGNSKAKMAYELYAYRIVKYIGAYLAVLSGADAILFTGGVGEHDAYLREMICRQLAWCGVELDVSKNSEDAKDLREISSLNSTIKILVVPTNEELEIANQSMALLDE